MLADWAPHCSNEAGWEGLLGWRETLPLCVQCVRPWENAHAGKIVGTERAADEVLADNRLQE